MSYLANILEQPQVLRSVTGTYKESPVWECLDRAWTARPSCRLVLTGLGASFNALYPARYYLHQQGIAALHLDTGELIHYLPELLQQPQPLMLAVASQSGESIEIQKLLEQIDRLDPEVKPWVVSVTNTADNSLSRQSDLALHTQAGTEVGVATKTYTSTLAVLHWLARALTRSLQPQDYLDVFQAAQQCEDLLQNWESLLEPAFDAVRQATSFALVARGPSIASACNGALVLQEAARKPAAGFVGSQFRHGPMEMLSPQLATLLFALPGRTLALSQSMARDICDRGGCLVAVGADIPDLHCARIPLPVMGEWISPMVDIVAVQLLVAKLAEAAGIVPGQFRWAGKVIQQE
ncbi:SIS domain-containing protein [Altericista sp. CCNU0014]|uniref:SIS domain-containing protein n=1 Tax=Altericista sp. CCNU0014 TaxID=3082949 RepID=UPI00384C0F60